MSIPDAVCPECTVRHPVMEDGTFPKHLDSYGVPCGLSDEEHIAAVKAKALRGALCTACGQRVVVVDGRYAVHTATRVSDGEPEWCPNNNKEAPCPVEPVSEAAKKKHAKCQACGRAVDAYMAQDQSGYIIPGHGNRFGAPCAWAGEPYVDPIEAGVERLRDQDAAAAKYRRERDQERNATEPGFRPADEWMADPPVEEVIHGVAARGCTTVITAESGGRKTFTTLDQASCISAGRSWHGRAVVQGAVAYLMFEGDDLGRRLRALREEKRDTQHVYLRRCRDTITPHRGRDGFETPSAFEERLRDELAALHAQDPLVAVYYDTVRASHSGSEDSSEDVSAYLRAARRCTPEGAATILVHHTGWQDGDSVKKRERGSSAFRGNVDYSHLIELVSEDWQTGEAVVEFKTAKVKDGPKPKPLGLRVKEVRYVWQDREDFSCVIDALGVEEVERIRTDARVAALQVVQDAVLGVLARDANVTAMADLAKKAGKRLGPTKDAVCALIEAGLVTHGKKGTPWTLTGVPR